MKGIKDYILTSKTESVVETAAPKKKQEINYELELASGCDFVITRKTVQTCKKFVCIISQHQFYIVNEKTEETVNATEQNLKDFFRQMKEPLPLTGVSWLSLFNREDIETYMRIFKTEDLCNMAKHGFDIMSIINNSTTNYSYYTPQLRHYTVMFAEKEKILKYMFDNLEGFPKCANISLMNFVRYLYTEYGDDIARFFIDKLSETALIFNIDHFNEYGEISKDLDSVSAKNSIKNFIEYLLFESVGQGYRSMNAFFIEYSDTLTMQKKIFGKIKEKYPEYLSSYHLRLATKYNQIVNAQRSENFNKFIESSEYTSLAYTGKKYSILVPSSPEQIGQEGIDLNHCVGSYIDKIANRGCKILFMRNNHSLDTSLVTIEVRGNLIAQVKGNRNRSATADEYAFVDTWAKEKGLNISPNVQCH